MVILISDLFTFISVPLPIYRNESFFYWRNGWIKSTINLKQYLFSIWKLQNALSMPSLVCGENFIKKASLDHILNNILVADVLYTVYLRYTSSLTASAEICQ